ncbi:hypothetical protein [Flavobacterium pectinovorum]|uniref:hypothetical protein n=1 Tax=Flavobacterium pectinovorum TaxID=29533 RepID=UPI001FAC6404|nr:hypothetical protein [Flavobacterium pectinovorum]MCI9846964.1 hypothetical protein [Flavobacterium pectinovorum]
MKRLFLTLFIMQILLARSQEKNLDKNSTSTIVGIIDIRDSNCLSEIERAKMDFKFQEIFYYIEPEGYLDSDSKRHHPYLKELLKEKQIGFSYSNETEFSLFKIGNERESYPAVTNCYSKASNELLNLKYGHNFTKQIERTADSLYVISRIEIPFQYPNGVDNYCMIYPNATEFLEQKAQIIKDFFTIFKFPNGFLKSINQRDFFAKTNFLIKRDSKVSDINIEIKFTNFENKKFTDSIVNQLKNFIENANWKPAISSGVLVNSKFEINFYN